MLHHIDLAFAMQTPILPKTILSRFYNKKKITKFSRLDISKIKKFPASIVLPVEENNGRNSN